MRIALVITEIYPGGAEKCFVNLAGYLQGRGHDIHVWQLWPKPPPEKSQLVQQLDDLGIAWSSAGAVKPWHFLRATRWLSSELELFQPQVVQAFLFHANIAAALATRRLDCRLFGGARVAQPERWRQRLQGWASKRMEKMVCVSQSVADHIAKNERVAGEKLSVIPNGIDLCQQAKPVTRNWSELGLPHPARVLLFVGRLTEQKGIVEFIERSARPLLEALPTHHLVMIGEGERGPALKQLCRASPVGERLHVVGWQPDAREWMRLAELIVLPAKYEGMPNVILEAMSVGKPVASFAVDGVAELLGSATDSKLQMAPPQDFDRLEALIVLLANHAGLRDECGRLNLHRAAEHFELKEQLAKYEQLYLAGPR